jgi:hypothetical protein
MILRKREKLSAARLEARRARVKARRRNRQVGFAQARRSLLALLELVRRGHTFTILRRGRPVAHLRQISR